MCFKMGAASSVRQQRDHSPHFQREEARPRGQHWTLDSLVENVFILTDCRLLSIVYPLFSCCWSLGVKSQKCATCQITCWIASDDNVPGKHFVTFLKAKVKRRLVVNEVTTHSEQEESYV